MPATATREKPIIFSGPMVRAILEGRKTQTRRVIKPQPSSECHSSDFRVERYCPVIEDRHGNMTDGPEIFGAYTEDEGWPCPFGGPGDRLWIKETARRASRKTDTGIERCVEYAADYHKKCDARVMQWTSGGGGVAPWRPSIHMPRWASRITLEITDVRVQRLQEITAGDIWQEGVRPDGVPETAGDGEGDSIDPIPLLYAEFEALWDSINANRGHGWEENPWVWALTFRVVKGDES